MPAMLLHTVIHGLELAPSLTRRRRADRSDFALDPAIVYVNFLSCDAHIPVFPCSAAA